MKKCSKCGAEKPLDGFPRLSRNKDGRHSQCLDCRRTQNLQYYHDNKSAINLERNRKRRETKYERNNSLRRRYGITVEQYEQLVAKQDNCCAICNQPERQTDKRYGTLLELAVDHCHTTGQIRGLLCSACNTAIGKFNDDPDLLEAAAQYLKKAKAPDRSQGQTLRN